MRCVTPTISVMTMFVVMACVAVAQPFEEPPSPPRGQRTAPLLMNKLKRMDKDDIRELIDTVRMVRLSQELELNDEQTVLLVRQYNKVKEEAAAIRKERREIAKELRELVITGAPQEELEKTLDRLIAKDKEAAMMRFESFERAAAGLTPAQKAKLYLFMGDFEKRMRSLIEKAKAQFRERRGEEMRESGPRRGGYGGGYGRGRAYGDRADRRRTPDEQPPSAEEEIPDPAERPGQQ